MYGWGGGGILHGRDLLKDYVGKAIGNGQTTRLWKDSWISLSEDTKQYGPIKEEHLDLRVSDLLTSELKWNRQRIEKLIPELASQIQCIQPSRSGAEDIFIWQPLPSGVYSTKSGYNTVASQAINRRRDSDDQSFDWIKDIWSGKYSPKLKTFLRSIIQNALPLGVNLQRRGMGVEVNCP